MWIWVLIWMLSWPWNETLRIKTALNLLIFKTISFRMKRISNLEILSFDCWPTTRALDSIMKAKYILLIISSKLKLLAIYNLLFECLFAGLRRSSTMFLCAYESGRGFIFHSKVKWLTCRKINFLKFEVYVILWLMNKPIHDSTNSIEHLARISCFIFIEKLHVDCQLRNDETVFNWNNLAMFPTKQED